MEGNSNNGAQTKLFSAFTPNGTMRNAYFQFSNDLKAAYTPRDRKTPPSIYHFPFNSMFTTFILKELFGLIVH